MGLQIDAKTYTAQDLDIRARVHAALTGPRAEMLLGRLFGDEEYGWVFSNGLTLYKAIDLLLRNPGSVPAEAAPFRRKVNAAPSDSSKVAVPEGLADSLAGRATRPVQLNLRNRTPRAGAVRVSDTVYTDAAGLAAAPELSALAAVADLIGDPRLRGLAADDFSRWSFGDWDEVRRALDGWNGSRPYPSALSKHRAPRHPQSVRTEYNPTAPVNADNLITQEKQFRNAWGVCGNTAEFFTARVQDLAGDVCLEDEFSVQGSAGGARLRDVLTSHVDERTLINVINPLIHEFIIEKRPGDQAAVLQQGYLGAYYATWWAGVVAEHLFLQAESRERAAVVDRRDSHGQARPVDLAALGDALAALLAADRLDSGQAAAAWRKLPFHPEARPSSAEAPSFTVRIWSVHAPDKVLATVQERLSGANKDWVTQLVMQEAAEHWRRIAAVKAKTI